MLLKLLRKCSCSCRNLQLVGSYKNKATSNCNRHLGRFETTQPAVPVPSNILCGKGPIIFISLTVLRTISVPTSVARSEHSLSSRLGSFSVLSFKYNLSSISGSFPSFIFVPSSNYNRSTTSGFLLSIVFWSFIALVYRSWNHLW